MSNRMPSLLALLGIAAAAGYQNRDKLGQLLDRIQRPDEGALADGSFGQTGQDRGQDGLQRSGATGLGQTLQAGVAELIDRFKGIGETEVPQSWVGTGQNKAIVPDRLRDVLGPDMIAELAAKTGMTEVDLLAQLARVLPDTVDHLTPEGRVASVDLQEPVQR